VFSAAIETNLLTAQALNHRLIFSFNFVIKNCSIILKSLIMGSLSNTDAC